MRVKKVATSVTLTIDVETNELRELREAQRQLQQLSSVIDNRLFGKPVREVVKTPLAFLSTIVSALEDRDLFDTE